MNYIFITILCCVVIASVTAVSPVFYIHVQECQNKTKATDEESRNVLHDILPKSTNEQCFLACLQKKAGWMGFDNKANIDKIKQGLETTRNINPDRYNKLKKIYEDCAAAETVEKDECKAAANFAACTYPKFLELAPAGPRSMRKILQDCRNSTGANMTEQATVIRSEIPKTKNEQCMLACVWKQRDMMTDDNKFNIEKIQEQSQILQRRNPEMYNKTIAIYEMCKTKETKEADECVAAKKFAECLFPKARLTRLSQRMKTRVDECTSKTNATELEVDNIIRNQLPKTKNERCMYACMQKQNGMMNEDNTFDVEKMKNTIKHIQERNPELYNNLTKLLDECKAEETKETDECVAAGKFVECYYKKQQQMRNAMAQNRNT